MVLPPLARSHPVLLGSEVRRLGAFFSYAPMLLRAHGLSQTLFRRPRHDGHVLALRQLGRDVAQFAAGAAALP